MGRMRRWMNTAHVVLLWLLILLGVIGFFASWLALVLRDLNVWSVIFSDGFFVLACLASGVGLHSRPGIRGMPTAVAVLCLMLATVSLLVTVVYS